MSYYACGKGTIILKHLSEDEICDVVKSLNFEDCDTIYDCLCEALNAEADYEKIESSYNKYSIDFGHDKYWDDNVTKFLQTIEPYTIEGEIEYAGEDQCLWRFHFRNNHWYFDVGHVEYVNSVTPLSYWGEEE